VHNSLELDKNEGNLYLKLRMLTESELLSGEWLSMYYDTNLNRIYTTFGSSELNVYGIFTPYVNVIRVGNIAEIKSNRGYLYYNSVGKIFGFEIEKINTEVRINEIDKNTEINQLNNYNKIYSSSSDDVYLIR